MVMPSASCLKVLAISQVRNFLQRRCSRINQLAAQKHGSDLQRDDYLFCWSISAASRIA
jgi:hypothetical protein